MNKQDWLTYLFATPGQQFHISTRSKIAFTLIAVMLLNALCRLSMYSQ